MKLERSEAEERIGASWPETKRNDDELKYMFFFYLGDNIRFCCCCWSLSFQNVCCIYMAIMEIPNPSV